MYIIASSQRVVKWTSPDKDAKMYLGVTMEKKTRADKTCYCTRCMFTVWKNELVSVSVGPSAYAHINCSAAIRDGSGRRIHPDFKHFLDHMDPERVEEILGA